MENTNSETVLFSLPLARLEPIFKGWVKDVLSENQQAIPQVAESDRWMNLPELCEYLPDRPQKATVYSWVSNSLIPCHKGGKKLRFLKSDIDNWMKSGRKKTFAELQAETSKRAKR